uniref:molybdopterin dinucleotide binding domain-containing protein n=1 Tax=Paraconexibacter sp. TaxID=2949640 RepID=UPI003567ADC8
LDEALAELEHYVAVDMYITETTRHAHVILPPVSHLERSDVDFVFPAVSVHNHIRPNPAAVPPPPDGRTDWQILWALAGRLGGGLAGRIQNGLVSLVGAVATPERIGDLALRTGPYGLLARGPFGSLTMGKVKESVHGIDLGPLQPRLASLMRTPKKRLRLTTPALLAAAEELEALAAEREMAAESGFDLTLIGRRQLRSNNSWMHNSPRLMKGADRCTAILHPDDASARGISEGDNVRVASRVGAIEVPVEISDEIRPGVVSVPHGFGHTRAGVGWKGAAAKAGASMNDITDASVVDALSGNAAFNAVAVRIEPIAGGDADATRDVASEPTAA